MAEVVDLVVWGDASAPEWPLGETARIDGALSSIRTEVERRTANGSAAWILLWDLRLGPPDAAVVEDLIGGRADVWHSGLCLGLSGQPAEHDYIHPTWPLAVDAPAGLESVSFRLSLGACLLRTEVVRELGGIDPGFRGPTGAGLELGRRFVDRGAVVMHTPRLVAGGWLSPDPLLEHDRFLFLWRVFGAKWVRYAAVRRILARGRPFAVRSALTSSRRTARSTPRPGGPGGSLSREPADVRVDGPVTVVLPTLGRYELLRPVLEQLRKQTVPIDQLVVVDQNTPERRDPALYEEFSDLNLEVVYQEQRGQWLARNAAIQASTGEWLAFVDDDSEVGPDFLERHLEGLARYDADLSTGASLAVIGAPVPESYSYFRVADQWDSGNGMCRRSLFEEFGLFDEQYDRQRRGDAEFGLRVQLGGGLVIHNPDAVRVHLKAQEGGLRTFGSLDGFRHRDRTAPLPLPSMVYYAKRFHSRRQLREDLLIGLVQAIVPYELKRRASPGQWLGFLGRELVHVPSTVRRVRTSLSLADEMVAEGPKIPELA